MNWRTGCVQYLMVDGHPGACLDPEPTPAQTAAQVAVVLVPLLIALSLLLWQLRKARIEREQREAERSARYNSFLELLRDVRMRLMN